MLPCSPTSTLFTFHEAMLQMQLISW